MWAHCPAGWGPHGREKGEKGLPPLPLFPAAVACGDQTPGTSIFEQRLAPAAFWWALGTLASDWDCILDSGFFEQLLVFLVLQAADGH